MLNSDSIQRSNTSCYILVETGASLLKRVLTLFMHICISRSWLFYICEQRFSIETRTVLRLSFLRPGKNYATAYEPLWIVLKHFRYCKFSVHRSHQESRVILSFWNNNTKKLSVYVFDTRDSLMVSTLTNPSILWASKLYKCKEKWHKRLPKNVQNFKIATTNL